MSAQAMLEQMRQALGWGEPNPVHAWYGSRNGAYFKRGSTPWCQMTVTWAAFHSGDYAAVCPAGDRAYTVWSAQDGERLGQWYAGTVANIKKHARPGALVYIDWAGTDQVGAIDHVGIVETNLGDGRVQTIEGNTADACKRRVRGAGVIAGFWNPAYSDDQEEEVRPAAAKPKPVKNWTETLVGTLPLLKLGADDYDVKTVRWLLGARGRRPLNLWATTFDEQLVADVKEFQKAAGLAVDGIVYIATWKALLRR